MRIITAVVCSVAAVIAASVAGCSAAGDLSTDPNAPAQAVTRVVIAPHADSLLVGQSLEYVAVALDASGRPVRGVQFAWTSAQPRVASVVAANPSDSARSTADSVGVTKIVAAANGVRSDSATLVVVATATVPAPMPPTDSIADTTGVLIDCNGIHQRVHAWEGTITLSYTHNASGTDTSANDLATFELRHTAAVTIRLDQHFGGPVVRWHNDHGTGAVQGEVKLLEREIHQSTLSTDSTRIEGDGKLSSDDSVTVADLTLDLRPGVCTYSFTLAGEQIDAESTIDDLTLPIKWGPGSVFSTNHPIASSAVGGQMLLLSGSAPFTAHVTALATGDGIYDLNPGAGWDMNYSGVAPEASLGSATVTWQFTVKP
jgi:hypothetical protein